jgi:hypothetical protein
MDWLRLTYIKVFEMPYGTVHVWVAWAIFFAVCLWAFFCSWWIAEDGWPG